MTETTHNEDNIMAHIQKVFNGVDPDTADEERRLRDRTEIRELYQVGHDDLLIVVAAHNFRLKGVGRWIEALALLRRDASLSPKSLVVGKDKPMRWQRMAASAGVSDRVEFVGATRRMQAFYHAADVLAHPTYYDPCSRVVLEGMVSGLPCVTTRYDGAAEVIEDGSNGFVLDSPEDVAGLAERVRRLSNPALRRTMGARAAQVWPQVSMARHAEGLVRLYGELTRRRAAV